MKVTGIRFLALCLLGTGLGFFLSRATEYGWFSTRWQPIDPPPEDVQHLLASSGDLLWVQGASGRTWELKLSDNCPAGCWKPVEQVPAPPPAAPSVLSVHPVQCAPPRPLIGARDSVGECRRETWLWTNSVFALRGRRSILHWEVDIYGEWAFMNEICAAVFGALAGIAVAVALSFASRAEAKPPTAGSGP
jgi:hypothetical protein